MNLIRQSNALSSSLQAFSSKVVPFATIPFQHQIQPYTTHNSKNSWQAGPKRKAKPTSPYSFPKPSRTTPPMGHKVILASKSKPLPSWSIPTPEQMALQQKVNQETYQPSQETSQALQQLKNETLYAIIELKGRHYYVTPGDVVVTPRMKSVDLGSILRLDRVREIGSKDNIIQGNPFVSPKYHKVEFVCIEHAVSNPVAIQKKRRRGHRPIIIHRDYKTLFRVSSVEVVV